jgi:hypothetical protein
MNKGNFCINGVYVSADYFIYHISKRENSFLRRVMQKNNESENTPLFFSPIENIKWDMQKESPIDNIKKFIKEAKNGN